MFQLIQHGEEAPTPKPKMELPQRFRIRPVTPVDKYIKVRKKPFSIPGFLSEKWRLLRALEASCPRREPGRRWALGTVPSRTSVNPEPHAY